MKIRSRVNVCRAQPWTRHLAVAYPASKNLYLARRSWDLGPHRRLHISVPEPTASLLCCAQAARQKRRDDSPEYPSAGRCSTPKAALVSTRSVSNKAFILNDFFSQSGFTETWIGTGAGESSVFGELCP